MLYFLKSKWFLPYKWIVIFLLSKPVLTWRPIQLPNDDSLCHNNLSITSIIHLLTYHCLITFVYLNYDDICLSDLVIPCVFISFFLSLECPLWIVSCTLPTPQRTALFQQFHLKSSSKIYGRNLKPIPQISVIYLIA